MSYNKDGFNREGKHKDTDDYYNAATPALDRYGFESDGYHIDTKEKYNKDGFNQEGIHNSTNNKYNEYGPGIFDENGFNREGFNKEGIHKETKTKSAPKWWEADQASA